MGRCSHSDCSLVKFCYWIKIILYIQQVLFSLNVSQQRGQYMTGMKGCSQLKFLQKEKMGYTESLQKTFLSRPKNTF